MISIRPAQAQDRDGTRRVGRLAILKLASGSYPPDVIEAWADWSRIPEILAEGDQRHSFVAVKDEEVVGFSIWMPHREEPKTAHIKAVFVHPDWARMGVGTRLLESAEQDAKASGFERFTVGASLNGLQFYGSVGYRKQGAKTLEIAPGIEMRFELMRKP